MFDLDLTPDVDLTSDLDLTPDLDISTIDDSLTMDEFTIDDHSFTFGDPSLLDWEQQIENDNCAVEAERAIINQFLPESHQLNQREAMYISSANGWYIEGFGTSPFNVGNMMELAGIPNHTVDNATVADLAAELAQGRGIIVGVDSKELWDKGPLADLKLWMGETLGVDFGGAGADHAVIVTGIDVSDPGNPMVILNDSGIPDGRGSAYPMEKFLQAWEDSGCRYTATDIPLPADSLHGMENMGMALGNMSQELSIGDVAGMAVGTATSHTTSNLLDKLFADDEVIVNL